MSNMVVNTNALALNAHRSMKNVGAAQAQASARLSSGLRINTAADDAAGLAISEKMRSQIRGLDMASKNAQDGSSLVQTAEGGMQQITSMVQRVRELAVQSANGTNTSLDRKKLQEEVKNLTQEITSMSGRTQFNKINLLDGSANISLQVGANAGADNRIGVKIGDMRNLGSGADVSDATKAASTISLMDAKLEFIATERANLGAIQNRLDYTIKSLDISSENLSAAESRIRDTDMAREMMNLTKTNVLSQAATSMLAQANQAPQNILQIIR